LLQLYLAEKEPKKEEVVIVQNPLLHLQDRRDKSSEKDNSETEKDPKKEEVIRVENPLLQLQGIRLKEKRRHRDKRLRTNSKTPLDRKRLFSTRKSTATESLKSNWINNSVNIWINHESSSKKRSSTVSGLLHHTQSAGSIKDGSSPVWVPGDKGDILIRNRANSDDRDSIIRNNTADSVLTDNRRVGKSGYLSDDGSSASDSDTKSYYSYASGSVDDSYKGFKIATTRVTKPIAKRARSKSNPQIYDASSEDDLIDVTGICKDNPSPFTTFPKLALPKHFLHEKISTVAEPTKVHVNPLHGLLLDSGTKNRNLNSREDLIATAKSMEHAKLSATLWKKIESLLKENSRLSAENFRLDNELERASAERDEKTIQLAEMKTREDEFITLARRTLYIWSREDTKKSNKVNNRYKKGFASNSLELKVPKREKKEKNKLFAKQDKDFLLQGLLVRDTEEHLRQEKEIIRDRLDYLLRELTDTELQESSEDVVVFMSSEVPKPSSKSELKVKKIRKMIRKRKKKEGDHSPTSTSEDNSHKPKLHKTDSQISNKNSSHKHDSSVDNDNNNEPNINHSKTNNTTNSDRVVVNKTKSESDSNNNGDRKESPNKVEGDEELFSESDGASSGDCSPSMSSGDDLVYNLNYTNHSNPPGDHNSSLDSDKLSLSGDKISCGGLKAANSPKFVPKEPHSGSDNEHHNNDKTTGSLNLSGDSNITEDNGNNGNSNNNRSRSNSNDENLTRIVNNNNSSTINEHDTNSNNNISNNEHNNGDSCDENSLEFNYNHRHKKEPYESELNDNNNNNADNKVDKITFDTISKTAKKKHKLRKHYSDKTWHGTENPNKASLSPKVLMRRKKKERPRRPSVGNWERDIITKFH